ncbi:MAG: hypothetical protein MZV70_19145 [Desulfobacterales bacterium]|nr:hypothetical protein [Desulfobacterales bacterium]
MRWEGSLPPAWNVPAFNWFEDDLDDGFDGRGSSPASSRCRPYVRKHRRRGSKW